MATHAAPIRVAGREADTSQVHLWLEARDLHTPDDAARVAEALNYRPEMADEVVHRRPMQAPLVLQRAFGHYPIATIALQTAIEREFIRTRGTSADADLLFRATLLLNGAGAAHVQAWMREVLSQHDASSVVADSAAPFGEMDAAASKVGIARLTETDPAAGQLYARFMDAPKNAVLQLLHEYNTNRPAFDNHVRRLTEFIDNEPKQAVSLVHEANALTGPGSVAVKLAISDALQPLIASDLTEMKSHVGGPLTASAGRERLDLIVPLLAEIVSQPDVAEVLVAASRSHKAEGAGRKQLATLMRLLLVESYSIATQARVRAVISAGTGQMLERSASLPPGHDRDRMGEAGGAYLGAAARSIADAKAQSEAIKAAVAKRTTTILTVVKMAVPAVKDGIEVGEFISSFAESNLSSEPDERPTWSSGDLDTLLDAVYSRVHERPKGPDDDPAVSAADAAFMDWRRIPDQAFRNQMGGQ